MSSPAAVNLSPAALQALLSSAVEAALQNQAEQNRAQVASAVQAALHNHPVQVQAALQSHPVQNQPAPKEEASHWQSQDWRAGTWEEPSAKRQKLEDSGKGSGKGYSKSSDWEEQQWERQAPSLDPKLMPEWQKKAEAQRAAGSLKSCKVCHYDAFLYKVPQEQDGKVKMCHMEGTPRCINWQCKSNAAPGGLDKVVQFLYSPEAFGFPQYPYWRNWLPEEVKAQQEHKVETELQLQKEAEVHLQALAEQEALERKQAAAKVAAQVFALRKAAADKKELKEATAASAQAAVPQVAAPQAAPTLAGQAPPVAVPVAAKPAPVAQPTVPAPVAPQVAPSKVLSTEETFNNRVDFVIKHLEGGQCIPEANHSLIFNKDNTLTHAGDLLLNACHILRGGNEKDKIIRAMVVRGINVLLGRVPACPVSHCQCQQCAEQLMQEDLSDINKK